MMAHRVKISDLMKQYEYCTTTALRAMVADLRDRVRQELAARDMFAASVAETQASRIERVIAARESN